MQFREEKLEVLTQGPHKNSPENQGWWTNALSPVFFYRILLLRKNYTHFMKKKFLLYENYYVFLNISSITDNYTSLRKSAFENYSKIIILK